MQPTGLQFDIVRQKTLVEGWDMKKAEAHAEIVQRGVKAALALPLVANPDYTSLPTPSTNYQADWVRRGLPLADLDALWSGNDTQAQAEVVVKLEAQVSRLSRTA